MDDDGFVEFPWARAHILQVVTVPVPRQEIAFELLQFENGQHALRLAAYSKGKLLEEPVTLHEEDLERLAEALTRAPTIRRFLERVTKGKRETESE